MRSFAPKLIVALALGAVVFAQTTKSQAADDIVETAVAAGSFKTLATALQAAGLVDALKSSGPFTVFAPTDQAFAKLPKETLQSLLQPENKGKLAGILKYHVVSGKVPASKVVKLTGVKTVNGQRVDIKVSEGGVSVDEANVIKTDIQCSNGIIHVIDRVILPASDNIPATAQKAGKFNTLVAAVKAAGLAEALSGSGPFTVFAPTDEAFAKLPEGTVKSLLKPENREKLVAILKYHVVKGRVYSDEAIQGGKAKTLQGQLLQIAVSGGDARVNKAKLVATDIDASNGVIHVIDSVLLPSTNKVGAAQARQMIQHAIARGSRLYNHGQHTRCANVYMSTIEKMMEYRSDLPEHVVNHLSSTLHKAKAEHCSTQQSWTLRRGLDRAFFAMRSQR